MVDVIARIQKFPNGYLQGGIFVANLFIKCLKHLFIQSRCRSAIGSQKWRLQQFKHSDTLFILGSGQSIATYSNEQFEEIEKHDSVGFNFWLLHPIVPTYYISEFKPESERSNLLWENLSIRALDYSTIPVILKYSSTLWTERHRVPQSLKRIFITSHMSIPGMTRDSLTRWFKILDSFNILCGALPAGLILFRQASLSWLLVFALQLGYKRIVFCGVDLNTPKYFYEIQTDFCLERGLLIPPPEFATPVHPTNNPARCLGGLLIADVLHIMNDVLLKKRGIEVFAGSESSALYPGFPLYPWHKTIPIEIDN